MKTFINADNIKEVRINESRVNRFIDMCNSAITTDKFTINDGLDGIPSLNSVEFETVKEMAKKEGWNLTKFEDNYNTTTYKLEKIK